MTGGQDRRVAARPDLAKVRECELESEALKSALARSKFARHPNFAAKIEGHIMLTDHGDEAWFRSVRIRETKAGSS